MWESVPSSLFRGVDSLWMAQNSRRHRLAVYMGTSAKLLDISLLDLSILSTFCQLPFPSMWHTRGTLLLSVNS